MKKFWFFLFFVLVSLLLSVSMVFPLIGFLKFDPYEKINPGLYFVLLSFFTTLFLNLLLKYRNQIQQFLIKSRSITRNKKILTLVGLLLAQMVIASICYTQYRANPKLYFLGTEIEERQSELFKLEIQRDLEDVKKFDNKINDDLNILRYLKKNQSSFTHSSDGKFLVSDSLYLILEYVFPPPGKSGAMFMHIYSKTELVKIGSLSFEIGPLNVIVENRIMELEKKLSLIQNDLEEITSNSQDLRWSYFQFFNYFFLGDLRPMSTFLIFMDGLKIFLGAVMAIVLALIIPELFQRDQVN